MTKLRSRDAGKADEVGKATKLASSWFPSSPSMSSISNFVSESSFKTGGYTIDGKLTRFKDEDITLFRLLHYKRPINNTCVCHHFGLLEVRLPSPLNLTNTLILFEKYKLKNDKNFKRVGRVTVHIFDQTLMKSNMEMVHEVKLEGCGKILMKDLLDHLTTKLPLSYSLWTNNCWKYVYDCQKKMLSAFAELPGTSPECKAYLENVRQNLRPPKLLSDVFDWQKFVEFAILVSGVAVLMSQELKAEGLKAEGLKTEGLTAEVLMEVKGLGTFPNATLPWVLRGLIWLGFRYLNNDQIKIVILITLMLVSMLLGIGVHNTMLPMDRRSEVEAMAVKVYAAVLADFWRDL